MTDEPIETIEMQRADQAWKVRTLAVGAVLGALTGLGAAYLLTRRAEQSGRQLSLSPNKGVQLGMLIAGLLRSILSLGDD